MAISVVDAQSVLAVDIGSVKTRVSLFDVVEGQYRFIASGIGPSTVGDPYFDVGEGMHLAVQNLESISGRILLADDKLILPVAENGKGIDRLVLTISAGEQLNLVVAGLLSDVSLESVQKLAASTYGKIVESIGLNDSRPMEMQLDAILDAEPNMILMAGGTDRGASRSVLKIAELVNLACRLLPDGKRPVVMYAGNQAVAYKIKEVMEKWTSFYLTSNIRPGIEVEDLGPSQEELAETVGMIRTAQIGGLQPLVPMLSTPLMPTAYTFGRMIRFLSRMYDPNKGVLGIDVGAGSTTVALGNAGQLLLNVLPLGMGRGIKNVLSGLILPGESTAQVNEITRWLAIDVPDDVVRDYLYQKALYPSSVPMDEEALAIEHALARYLLSQALQQTRQRWRNMSSVFEPIIASGAVFGQSPRPAQSLLMLLDGLQPAGVSTCVLDQHSLLASLGAAAKINSLLPIQVLESGAFLNLGSIICPISQARYGTTILRMRLEYEEGRQEKLDIRQGELTILPLHAGQIANVHLEALQNTRLDAYGHLTSGSFKIIGGICGAVIDTRGRPLLLPADASKRRELLGKWALALA